MSTQLASGCEALQPACCGSVALRPPCLLPRRPAVRAPRRPACPRPSPAPTRPPLRLSARADMFYHTVGLRTMCSAHAAHRIKTAPTPGTCGFVPPRRVSSASSQEISCAHDIVRIWAALHQGQVRGTAPVLRGRQVSGGGEGREDDGVSSVTALLQARAPAARRRLAAMLRWPVACVASAA